jgi:hypothetical protein
MKIMSWIVSKWRGKRGIVLKKGFKKQNFHSFHFITSWSLSQEAPTSFSLYSTPFFLFTNNNLSLPSILTCIMQLEHYKLKEFPHTTSVPFTRASHSLSLEPNFKYMQFLENGGLYVLHGWLIKDYLPKILLIEVWWWCLVFPSLRFNSKNPLNPNSQLFCSCVACMNMSFVGGWKTRLKIKDWSWWCNSNQRSCLLSIRATRSASCVTRCSEYIRTTLVSACVLSPL